MTDLHPLEYELCDEHEWAGYGECPGCKGERLADESVDALLYREGSD